MRQKTARRALMGRATGRFTMSERHFSEMHFSEAPLRGKCWWLGELPESGLSGLSGVQAQIITRLRAQARERGRGWHTAKQNAGGFLQR